MWLECNRACWTVGYVSRCRGGRLTIRWEGPGHSVFLRGPAVTVFHTEVDVPDAPVLSGDI